MSAGASGRASSRSLGSTPRSWFGDFVLVLFLCAQVLDGVFTYHGISRFGLSEGNPVIAWYMGHFGVGPTVTVAKIVATGCALVLHVLAFHKMLGLLTVMYLSLAVLPWTILLFFVR